MRGVLHGGVACNASSGLSRARRELLLELRGAARDLGALRRGDLRVRRELLLPVQDVVLLVHLLDPGGVIAVY